MNATPKLKRWRWEFQVGKWKQENPFILEGYFLGPFMFAKIYNDPEEVEWRNRRVAEGEHRQGRAARGGVK